VRVDVYEQGAGGSVDIVDGIGWNIFRLAGTKSQVIDQIVKLQYELSLALDTVSEWDHQKPWLCTGCGVTLPRDYGRTTCHACWVLEV